MTSTRRRFLRGLGAAGLLPLAGPRARASVAPEGRRLVTVFAAGGWDVTRVYAPVFGSDTVDMEAEATEAESGGLVFVDHPDRPSVRDFFERYGPRTAIVNGIQVPAVAHESCLSLISTGVIGGRRSDWATWIAAARGDAFALPHLVLGSVAYPGERTEMVCSLGRNGQLDRLLSGELLAAGGGTVPSDAAQALLDAHAAARAQAAAGGGAAFADYASSVDRGVRLKAQAADLSFAYTDAFADQVAVVAGALAADVSRCVTLQVPVGDLRGWDHHNQNDLLQSEAFEDLFAGLLLLLETLDATPGPQGGSLADETVIAVVSEMGRTPWLTATGGKDHWPFTSVMLLGAGVAGGRVVGSYDADLYGETRLGVADLGTTLLELCGVDPGEAGVSGGIPGVIA